jgi:hypothetical protein
MAEATQGQATEKKSNEKEEVVEEIEKRMAETFMINHVNNNISKK